MTERITLFARRGRKALVISRAGKGPGSPWNSVWGLGCQRRHSRCASSPAWPQTGRASLLSEVHRVKVEATLGAGDVRGAMEGRLVSLRDSWK